MGTLKILSCAALIAFTLPAAAQERPDLAFTPDMNWARVAFDPASATKWDALVTWMVRRSHELGAEKTNALRAVVPGALPQPADCYDDIACYAIETLNPLRKSIASPAEFEAARARAAEFAKIEQMHFDGMMNLSDASLRENLLMYANRDQTLLHVHVALLDEGATPTLSKPARELAQLGVMLVVKKALAEEKDYLAGVFAKDGWPGRAKSGGAGHLAWLIVQHADDDPAFQAKVLDYFSTHRDDVEPRDYALLYDRVHLKTTGKQRYASQMQCVNGDFEPKPLEDEKNVDALRASVTLKPLTAYRKDMEAMYGKPCH